MANKYPGQCGSCRAQVATGAGIAEKRGPVWMVFCDTAHAAAVPIPAQAPTPSGPPPAEVRVTGTEQQCAAIWDALRLSAGMTIIRREDQPRRDVGDDRTAAYGRVQVDPKIMDVVARAYGLDIR
ncbi:hypothetical protein QMK19_29000 [Streptomyces sp. H10-C2]|uniref:hypothetical protein n=1 Tax=Streptomyces TaxID=1883 RepID=UPI0018E057BD|nr:MULTISPECIES: hypothetical protein [Streptomyces]MDJ0344249.1 hypothetical protein [Streptomyces sp. PH10-H1]MDJ0373587.1 hypothetical protein [Streptomyces sp. H10-C2]